MTEQANRCYRLRRRPHGAVIEEADPEFVEEVVCQRPWMADLRSYIAPVAMDAVMRGIGVGEVVESGRDDMQAGRPGLRLHGLAGPEPSARVTRARRVRICFRTDEAPHSRSPSGTGEPPRCRTEAKRRCDLAILCPG
jgi:hypothetical protein